MSQYTNLTWCEWCVADSGRTHATRACCIARRVSKMMPAARMIALRTASESDVAPLRAAALRAISMRICRLPREARIEQYRHALRDGWLPDDIEVLKRFTREEFDRGNADGV